MPMPREDDDDLFHDEADVDFADDAVEEAPKKKAAKKKTAKKAATAKKGAKKKAAPKKKAASKDDGEAPAKPKKKAKRVVASADDEPAPRPRKKKKSAPKPKKQQSVFGEGLIDPPEGGHAEETAEKEPKAKAPERDSEKPLDDAPATEEAAQANAESGDQVDEYGRPTEAAANYVVHLYELGRLKRTFDRDFTAEDAEAFATEYSRTSKRYGRQAVAGKKDTQPVKVLES